VKTYTCSACGAGIQLSGAVPYGVCSFCQSLLLRRDLLLENIGRVAEVPDDFSPLQLGTTGYFENQQFALVGRVRKRWDEGSWNEWCVLFDDQRIGWLAEVQGDWVMLFEQSRDTLRTIPVADRADAINVDDTFWISNKRFSVSDIKRVHYNAAEGELTGFQFCREGVLSIDLRGEKLGFATLEFQENDVAVFVGRFIEFDECRFVGLRELEGWG